MVWTDCGVLDKTIVAANGALDGAALIGRALAVIEEVVGAESAMTVMLASLGAGLQGFCPGITPEGAIDLGQTSVDALALWEADTVHRETRAHIGRTAARYDLRPTVRQELPAAEGAHNRMTTDSDFVRFLPEITSRPNVGWRPLPESPMLQPRARNESPAASSPRSATNSANDPKLVTQENGEENQMIEAFSEQSALIASVIGSRAYCFAPAHSRNLNVTRTESVAQLRPLSGATIELTQQLDGQASGTREAAPSTAPAPLDKNTPATRAWQKSHGDKTALPDARLDKLRCAQISGVSSEPKVGVVVVDGGYLGRWVFDCLSRQVTRPSGGTTGIDPRVSATYPGAAVGV